MRTISALLLCIMAGTAMAQTRHGEGQYWPEDRIGWLQIEEKLSFAAGAYLYSTEDTLQIADDVVIDSTLTVTGDLSATLVGTTADDPALTLGAGTVGDQDISVYADSGGTAFGLFKWDEGNDLLDFLEATRFGELRTPDDGGEVAIFNRDVSSSAVDGTKQGVIIRVDTTDAFAAGYLADGSGGVDSAYCEIGAGGSHGLTMSAFSDSGWIDINPSGAGLLGIGGVGDNDTLDLSHCVTTGLTTDDEWECENIAVGAATVGGTAPTATTVGNSRGLAFDADAEVSFLLGVVRSDWNGSSDLELKVIWIPEAGDALLDTETVKWDAHYYAISGEDGSEAIDNGTEVTATTTYTQSGAGTDKGQHITTITIDHDNANQPLAAGDKVYIAFDRDVSGDSYAGDGIVLGWRWRQLAN